VRQRRNAKTQQHNNDGARAKKFYSASAKKATALAPTQQQKGVWRNNEGAIEAPKSNTTKQQNQ